MDRNSINDVVVIPAYHPGAPLLELVQALSGAGMQVIVVDDGSGPEFRDCFNQLRLAPGTRILRHAVNLGKGAALKTGLNYALTHYPEAIGVVTADADGQHHPEDILRVAAMLRSSPDALVLGMRDFKRPGIPVRSRTGNIATRFLLRLALGQNIRDTQTGLRGIPRALIPHLLRLPTSGYEFELDMLMACKHQAVPIVEQPVRTIYSGDNSSSHFRPVLDSMRIYFLLFRFSALSLSTALLDNAVFAAVFQATGSIAHSQIAARCLAAAFNYSGARHYVFHSQQRHAVVLPKYLALVLVNGLFSYAFIEYLHGVRDVAAIPAKLLAEGLLFIANFAIQRDFVFTRRRNAAAATDWDDYYQSAPATAKLTRKYTASVLLKSLKRFRGQNRDQQLSIVEIGGANSCFLDQILAEMTPRSYDVIDTNQYGLSLLERRVGQNGIVRLHQESVLALSEPLPEADVVFSVGLVEHFDSDATGKAVRAHFDLLRSGGLAIITFPTPTVLYRVARAALEVFGMWKFHDERPLDPAEVRAAIGGRGTIVHEQTLWPLILTQHLVVARKS
jgi:glycosyltransferase involved in cell wall biosynthesis